MLFKELINRVNYEDVWNVLEREYDLNSKAYQAYKKVIEELRLLDSSSSEIEVTLVVAKVEDWSEPGKMIYEVFGVGEDDENRYALEMSHGRNGIIMMFWRSL